MHRFKIGEMVELTLDRLQHTQGGSFEVLGLLPPVHDDPQYLVKSELEKCRRVVVQSVMKPRAHRSTW